MVGSYVGWGERVGKKELENVLRRGGEGLRRRQCDKKNFSKFRGAAEPGR